MIKHRSSTWKNNNGNFLLATAVIACIVMSLVWERLPRIELNTTESTAPPAVRGVRPIAVLVVSVQPEVNHPCFVEVFRPFGKISPTATPVAFREFPAGPSSSTVAVFTELRPGDYVVGAYLDLDENGELNGEEELATRTFYQPNKLDEPPVDWVEW